MAKRVKSITAVALTCVIILFATGVMCLYHYYFSAASISDHDEHGARYATSDGIIRQREEEYTRALDINLKYEDLSSRHVPMSLQMELVTVFHLNYNASDRIIRQREKEYMRALDINLEHDHVKRIHVLTNDAEKLEQRLQNFQLSDRRKLVIAERQHLKMTRDIYDYISENLVGVDVMFLNGDIYLGGGFDRVDPIVMRRNKIMYALTRRVKKEESCGEVDKCVGLSYYKGSHDTFLFHLTEPIPESALKHLNFKFASWGVENVVMWVFQTKLGYCLLNPCTILKTFHLHCTNLRGTDRIRVNNINNTGRAFITKELVCVPEA